MSSSPVLAPGTLISGRYRIEAVLGGEGSAAVYRAADTRLERPVALRAIDAREAGSAGAQQGRAAARLVHANVARVLDFGEDAEAGLHFVVADLGSGGTLAALLAQRGTPPLPLAMRMLQEAAAGMAAAHHAGLVHGDLHPGVLWLSRDEGRLRVQVLGLGLDPSGSAPPRATARYASPERLRRAASLGPAADVFSLGVVGFEVLAGLPEDWTSLLLAMARGKAVVAPSPAELRPEIPPHAAQAVRRALVADPADRWTDAGEMAAQLFSEREPVHAPRPELPAAVVASPAAPAPAPEPPPAPAPPSPAAKPAARAPKPRKAPVLADTDLADTLYIPPASERPAPAPAPAAAASPAHSEPAPVAVPPAPEPAVAKAAAPVPPAPKPVAAPVPAELAGPGRRRPGMERLGKSGRGSRVPIAAGVVLALLVGGGVVAKTVLAGPEAAAPAAANLAARAVTGPAPAETVESPHPAPAAPAAAADAPPPAPLPAPAAEDGGREREAERLRAEERRRQQQRADSIRAAREAAVREAAAQPPASPQQQVALAAPRSVEERQPAQAIDQAVDAPAAAAPARAAADPNRVYGAGEVDRLPSISNAAAFRSAVQRTYPATLRGSSTGASAVVTFIVLPDGRVDRASVVVGEVSHPAFRGAAAAAIVQARFTPALVGGRGVRTQVTMPITWQPADRDE